MRSVMRRLASSPRYDFNAGSSCGLTNICVSRIHSSQLPDRCAHFWQKICQRPQVQKYIDQEIRSEINQLPPFEDGLALNVIRAEARRHR
jgi:hypothetical protein